MFLGSGAVASYSRKVKNNTRSSTETELLAADMFLPEMLWSLYFIQAQGYETERVELYQDNVSAQFLEINGKFSSSKKTKHIKAKFFFIKDKIDDGDVKVVDCPTEVMWADVQTKPMQGKAYRVQRAQLMNCPVDYLDEDLGGKVARSAGDDVGVAAKSAAKNYDVKGTRGSKGIKPAIKRDPVDGAKPASFGRALQECVEQGRILHRTKSGTSRVKFWGRGKPARGPRTGHYGACREAPKYVAQQ